MTAGITDHTAVGTGSEGVVVVVWKEVYLVIVLVGTVEVEVIVIAVVPMVIPHSHSNVYGIGLQKEIHVADLFDPFVETVFFFAGQFEYEILQLLLGCGKVLFIALELVGIVDAVVLVPIEFPVICASKVCRTTFAIYAFPEIAFVTLEHAFHSLLDEFVVYRLDHVVYSKISFFSISLDLKPHSAVGRECTGPYAITAEQIVAVKFPYIARVVLEPFEVDLSYALDGVVVILVEFSEIDAEMAVMPVRVLRVVDLSSVSFRTATRCVSAKPYTTVLDEDHLLTFLICEISMEIIHIMLVFIISGQQLVPFFRCDVNGDFRYHGFIPHI